MSKHGLQEKDKQMTVQNTLPSLYSPFEDGFLCLLVSLRLVLGVKSWVTFCSGNINH